MRLPRNRTIYENVNIAIHSKNIPWQLFSDISLRTSILCDNVIMNFHSNDI